MDEQAIRKQISRRFWRRDIFLLHFMVWAVLGLIIGGVIIPPVEIVRVLRPIFQSWALIVAAHGGLLIYLEFRERAIRREVERTRGIYRAEKRKREPIHDLELEEADAWNEVEDSPEHKRYRD